MTAFRLKLEEEEETNKQTNKQKKNKRETTFQTLNKSPTTKNKK